MAIGIIWGKVKLTGGRKVFPLNWAANSPEEADAMPPILDSEPQRLAALAEYAFDEGRELPSLGPVVSMAARIFNAPISLVNMGNLSQPHD